jgi:hypothetical protein
MSGLNSIIESHKEFISATYQCPRKEPSGSHGQVIVLVPTVYNTHDTGPNAWFLVKRKQQHLFEFQIQRIKARSSGSNALHVYNDPMKKIDVRKRGADSSSSSGELGRCLECFSARNIIPTKQSVPESTSPHSAG